MKQGRTRLEMDQHIEEAKFRGIKGKGALAIYPMKQKDLNMKKVKKNLLAAYNKLAEAAHAVDTAANPDIANKIFDLQEQIANLNKMIN